MGGLSNAGGSGTNCKLGLAIVLCEKCGAMYARLPNVIAWYRDLTQLNAILLAT